MTPVDTIQMNACLGRWRAGEAAAADALLASVYPRLEALARKMLRGFPGVRRVGDTGDVLQNSVLRLMRSLRQLETPPGTTREFFGLAAVEIRRELLDLARLASSNKRRLEVAMGDEAAEAAIDPHAAPAELERWAAFHEAAGRLPADEREVLGLVFYHGWTHSQVAALFGVSERTVARRWLSAMIRLKAELKGGLPTE